MMLFLFIAEANLKEQVDKSFNLPPTYETLVSRAQLASVSSSYIHQYEKHSLIFPRRIRLIIIFKENMTLRREQNMFQLT